MQRISKKAIINMLIVAAIVAAILLAVALFIWKAALGPLNINWLGGLYFGLLAILLAAILAAPFIRYRRYRYQIDKERILVSEGLIFKTTSFAPIERVHQISVSEGPIDRLTGLAKVVATTAGGEITVRFLYKKEALRLSSYIESTIKIGLGGRGNGNEV